MHQAGKPATPRQLFVERMKREGRGAEWHERVNQAIQATGKKFHQVAHGVMCSMGYEGPEREREIDREFRSQLHRTAAQVELRAERAELIREQEAYDFDSAVKLLPDRAPIQVELDWIQAHPAMARKNQSKNNLDPIVLDVNDILCPPHGRAPSKGAVYQLQHWCNHPNEFYKQLLSEHKKATEGESAARAAQKDVGLTEVEQLLAGFHKEFGRVLGGIKDGDGRSQSGTAVPDVGSGHVGPCAPDEPSAEGAVDDAPARIP